MLGVLVLLGCAAGCMLVAALVYWIFFDPMQPPPPTVREKLLKNASKGLDKDTRRR